MFPTLLIVFREIIEAGLVIGIVLAATRGVAGRGWWIAGGIAAGASGAGLVAAFAGVIGAALQGNGQELFNAAILSAAVLMLGWHNVWMKTHGRVLAAEMRTVGNEVAAGSRSLAALAIVCGVAVLREGSEIVLFLYGVAVGGGNGAASMLVGGLLGLACGVALSALMYFGLLRIPTRHFFAATGALITLLAAGMAAQAVAFLTQAGYLNILTGTVWNTARFLPEASIPGRALHALVGYTDQPTALQLIVYLAVAGTIFALMELTGHPRRRPSAMPAYTPSAIAE